MNEAGVAAVLTGLRQAGVSIACYLPDSLFRGLYPALDADPAIRTIRVTNEGEGAAICGGVFLSGKRAVLVMENSGLRASIEPLARMGMGAGIPVVMLMSYRGELGENNWWAIPHGMTMEPLLNAMRIPYRVVTRVEDIAGAIADAFTWAYSAYYHAAVCLGGATVRTA
jgi:sulfopyruvate decarboxylase subunit alpha